MEEIRMERQSSIEKEPRTLNIHQLHFAREAALYVVNTSSIEEAVRIFTQGLEPVGRCAESDGHRWMGSGSDGEDHNNDEMVGGLRDIVSAPF